MTKYVKSIECSDQPLDVSFHPKRDSLCACALIDGTVEVHDFLAENAMDEDDGEPDTILSSMSVHTQILSVKQNEKITTKPASCRAISFSPDGEKIYTGGSAGDMTALDSSRVCSFSSNSEKNLLWNIEPATEGEFNPLVKIYPFHNSPLIATGDDFGGVRIWDSRLCGGGMKSKSKRPEGCVFSWKENEDYISDFDLSADGNILLATCADGRLSVFDLRIAREPVTGKIPFRLSDDQEDELLSLKIIKGGNKVVCGSQEGVLSIFSWNTWGDCSDRFPGHPSSIDAILKVDEDTILTGSSDGLIRVAQIQPDRFVGVLGNHSDYPIEKLEWNSDRSVVGSVSHDNYIRLWDAQVLLEEGLEGVESGDEGTSKPVAAKIAAKSASKDDSEDDWEDEDEDENDGDSDSDDSDEEDGPSMNDRRKKRLKTENEKFFDDL